jgi:hypothetical protein
LLNEELIESVHVITPLKNGQPDIWRYIEEIREAGLGSNPNDYR